MLLFLCSFVFHCRLISIFRIFFYFIHRSYEAFGLFVCIRRHRTTQHGHKNFTFYKSEYALKFTESFNCDLHVYLLGQPNWWPIPISTNVSLRVWYISKNLQTPGLAGGTQIELRSRVHMANTMDSVPTSISISTGPSAARLYAKLKIQNPNRTFSDVSSSAPHQTRYPGRHFTGGAGSGTSRPPRRSSRQRVHQWTARSTWG